MARRGRHSRRYPRLDAALPPHLYARLHAASTVLGVPVDGLVESALEARLQELDETQLELIDRIASETVQRTERE